ncbi:hypothetical protein [Chryseobacterium sp.]|uniref:hypothetical protein n=1 Tax=Chryseobacterium sp. TaxID=1871047 RepID=UPI00388F0054
MKILDFKESKKGFQILDENKKTVGEFVYGYITGWNEKLIIEVKIYTLHYQGFLWKDVYILDQFKNKILQLDFDKNRIFYYGESTEIYQYKIKDGLSSQFQIFNNVETLVNVGVQSGFLKTKYTIEVSEN